MPQCAVPGCRKGGVHIFPKDPIVRKEWEKAIRREKSATDNLRLCKNHFKKSDYVGTSTYTGRPHLTRYLRKGVIPSIFPWTQKSDEADLSNTAVKTKQLVIADQNIKQEKEGDAESCLKAQNKLQKPNKKRVSRRSESSLVKLLH